MGGYAETLPKDLLTVEVLESVEPDAEVVGACKRLKGLGYELALDDFVADTGYEELIPLANIIKVDLRLASFKQQRDLFRRYGRSGVRFLAEKVETAEEFERSRDAGYTLFQGYFFCRPKIVVGKEVPGFKLNYIRVLKEISSPDVDFTAIENAVKHDASLVHKLLRYVNSARFARQTSVDSIGHALVLLGEQEIRKWITLVAMSGLASDKPQELVRQAVVRGKFCEEIAPAMGLGSSKPEMFLLGMFSLLDAVLDQPMEQVLRELPVAPDIKDTLLESPDAPPSMRALLRLAKAYEKGNWGGAEKVIADEGVSGSLLLNCYMEALEFAGELLNS